MIDLTPIINAVIALLAMLVTTFLVPWLKANASAKQLEALENACRIAAFAAEQIYGSGHGAEKMDYAIEWLEKKGYKVDRAMIESTVCNYFGHWDDNEKEPHQEANTEEA